ncbi:MAG: hypothetical protein ACP5QO_09335 [Clostridia bacterium]
MAAGWCAPHHLGRPHHALAALLHRAVRPEPDPAGEVRPGAKAPADQLDQNGSIIGQAPGPSLINDAAGLNAANETEILKHLAAKLQHAITQQGLENPITVITTPDGSLCACRTICSIPPVPRHSRLRE